MLDRRHFLIDCQLAALPRPTLRGNLVAQLAKVPLLRFPILPCSTRTKTPTGPRCASNSSSRKTRFISTTAPSAPVPRPCCAPIFEGYTTTERMDQQDPEDYPIWGYAAWNEFRDPLAAFVGCHRDEIALLRNATEANSYIANGIDLKPGDEVLMTDQEHPGGEHPWNLKAKRYGIVVKKVTLTAARKGRRPGTQSLQ